MLSGFSKREDMTRKVTITSVLCQVKGLFVSSFRVTYLGMSVMHNNDGKGSEAGQVSQEKSSGEISLYAKKKTLAEGLLDIGLLISNASQLKALLSYGSLHEYYWAMLVLLILSILLQVVLGVLLIILGATEGENKNERRSNILNNVVVGIIFFITVINVFTGAFGIKISG